jgi:hypothetical protein
VVPGTASVTSRTITVILGTATNSGASAPGNEAQINYLDEVASPGTLKVCKLPGTTPGPPIGNSFNFTVTVGSGTPQSIVVPLNDCIYLTGIPFNSAVAITEANSTGNAVSAISENLTDVTEYVGTVNTVTSEPVVSAGPTFPVVGPPAAAGTVTVQISEAVITEVDFTDIDPPVVTPGSGNSGVGTGTVTVANPGTNAGLTTATSFTTATNVATGIATVSAAAPVVSTTAAIVPKPMTKAQKKALLNKYEKTLANVEKTITKDQKVYAHSTGKKHVAEGKVLASLRSEVRVLNREIKALK